MTATCRTFFFPARMEIEDYRKLLGKIFRHKLFSLLSDYVAKLKIVKKKSLAYFEHIFLLSPKLMLSITIKVKLSFLFSRLFEGFIHQSRLTYPIFSNSDNLRVMIHYSFLNRAESDKHST